MENILYNLTGTASLHEWESLLSSPLLSSSLLFSVVYSNLDLSFADSNLTLRHTSTLFCNDSSAFLISCLLTSVSYMNVGP